LKQLGIEKHRSGWPFVIEHLKKFHRSDGMLLDDFVERSFQFPATRQQWREPWVGIFHHPPNLPDWLDPTALIKTIISTPEFRASLLHLKGAIALSKYLGKWLYAELRCPVLVRKHPTEIPRLTFSLERWEAQEKRRIVQIGWYARNHRAIYQLDVPDGFQKVHLLQDKHWIAEAIARTDKFSPYRDQPWLGDVYILRDLNNSQYDYLMASSVILNQYWDVSASNTVVEAIARCTPLLVNRHPALVEYLGSDYPLYFDELRDVRTLLKDSARIRQGWRHLVEMDKSWLSASNFAREVVSFVHDVSRSNAIPPDCVSSD
jgi:hypothetical protein